MEDSYLDKNMYSRLVKKVSAFYGTKSFIYVFTRDHANILFNIS
jgi:hypothetical protein